jgi:chemotaxis protein methyltransferase CheR
MSLQDRIEAAQQRPAAARATGFTAGLKVDDFVALCELVRTLCDVDLSQYKRGQMERRVRTWAQRRGTPDLAEYGRRLRREPEELDAFLDRVTINVSHLWRHEEQWDALQKKILPELARERHGRIRCWSAGSSYGAEAYTLAAVAREAVPTARIEIQGTDLDRRMVARAREGVFRAEDGRTAPQALMRKHFEPTGDGGWKAKDELRRMVRFDTGDLLRMPIPADRYDVILCRNTVIYFTEEVRDALHERLARALAPGGYLIVGTSERVADPRALGMTSPFHFIYRKS